MTRRFAIGALLCADAKGASSKVMTQSCQYSSAMIQAVAPNDSIIALHSKPRSRSAEDSGVNAYSLVQFCDLESPCVARELRIKGSHFDAVFDELSARLLVVTTNFSPLIHEFWSVDVKKMSSAKIRVLNVGVGVSFLPMRNGKILAFITERQKGISALRLITLDPDESSGPFDWSSGALVRESEPVLAQSCLSSDSKIVAYPTSRHKFALRETNAFNSLGEIKTHEDLILREISISADSRFVAVSLVDSQLVDRVKRHVLRVYSVSERKNLWEIEAPPADIISVAPGGKRLAIGRRKTDRLGTVSQLVEVYEPGNTDPIADAVVRSIWRPRTIMETLFQRLMFAGNGTTLIATARDTKTYLL